jgi:hypothetical protein
VALGLLPCSAPALAQTKPVLKLKTPETAIRRVGADCLMTCRLSGLFAPAVVRDNVAALAVTKGSPVSVKLTAKFIPTNGLALAQKNEFLELQQLSSKSVCGQCRSDHRG